MLKKLVLLFFLLGFALIGFSQNTRDVGVPTPPKPVYQQNKKVKKSFFSFLHKKNKDNEEVAREFDKRMKAVVKQKSKEERMASKPQYNDPSYFGHKRKPKKRKNGKKKFCKECGLWH